MRQILIVFILLLVFSIGLQCENKKKPNDTNLEDPGRFFPINFEYTWTYTVLGQGCVTTDNDIVITAQSKTTREVEGVMHNGWDLVTVSGGQGSGFVYRLADTIFYWRDIQNPDQPPYKILVGPVKAGTNWRDRTIYGFEYLIEGIEDFYSPTANNNFERCARIKRIKPGENQFKYYWWAPAWGKVREANFQSEQCLGGEDLKRLDKNPEYP